MRVAVIGAGRMGKAHVQAWSALAPDVELAAVVDRRPSAAPALAPGVPTTTDLETVLTDRSVGIVSICTPTDTHLALTARALDAGKHVLLEKPLAPTLPDGERLVALGRRGPGMLMVAHVVRFFPGYAAVRGLVEEGALGTIREARANRLSASGGRPPWLDDETRSGGFLLDLAVHDFDQLLLLLGPARRVDARPAADGAAEVVVEHSDGGRGHVLAGWDLPVGHPFTTLLDVRGDAGSARYTALGDDVSELEVEAGKGVARSRIEPGEPYAAQARYFLERVRTGEPPVHGDPGAALAAVRLALGARTSLTTGRAVDLD